RLPSIQSCTSYSESFPKIGIHLCGGCPDAFASPQVLLPLCLDGGGTYVRVRVTPTQEDSSHGLNSVGHHTPSPREILAQESQGVSFVHQRGSLGLESPPPSAATPRVPLLFASRYEDR